MKSEAGKRLPTSNPRLTAGFKWQPEMWPMANAMVRTVSPKASATPANLMPSVGNPAASTAAPHPPKTSQKVRKNSAMARLVSGMKSLLRRERSNVGVAGARVFPRGGRLAQGGKKEKVGATQRCQRKSLKFLVL